MEGQPLFFAMTEIVKPKVLDLLAEHEAWRGTTLNLIASENLISPAVRAALSNDLVGRYTDYDDRDLTSRRYQGNKFVVEIEREAEALAQQLFGASEIDLRPLSGHVAGISVILGLCEPGDAILEVGRDGGSHRMATKLVMGDAVDISAEFMPFDQSRWNIDVPAALKMIEERQPKLVILGSSAFLFPHPVREIADAVHRIPGSALIYDASHVMGLLAGGVFQSPLEEGADVVYGSTHKTLPGPQGGIIFSNHPDLMDKIAGALYPPIVTNHHSFRIPALAVAFDEMLRCGADYACQIIANARQLGAELAAQGWPPLSFDGRYTDSHTLLVPLGDLADGAADRLESCGIITGSFVVPAALGGQGIRMGTQEITRMGAQENDMATVARLIKMAAAGEAPPDTIAQDARAFVEGLPGLAYV
jgi:glycine hydroxymethyltransferase